MREPLRILILDDNPSDAELAERELAKCGRPLEVENVADRRGFEDRLARDKYDIVLADYSIPGFDGMEAAHMVRELDDLLPVILVTGALDEETAVDCMKAGAWDYVLKEHLARLCPAVSGALRTRQALWEKKKSDQKALRAALEWQATFEAIGDGVSLLDRTGAVRRWNRTFEAIAAMPGEQIAGRPCCEVLESGHRAREGCVFRRMLENGRRESQEFELAGRWYRETSDPVFDREGEISSAVYVVTDVTDRRNMEDELAGERNLLKTLVDALPDTVYVKDQEGRFVAANTAEARLVGAERTADLVGKTDFDFYPREYADQYYHDEQIILKTGNPLINKEEIIVNPDGDRKVFYTSKVPVRGDKGEITGIVGICRDVTAQKETEKKLEEQRRQLQQSQRIEAVGRLAGGIAHDFNNMLTAIIGYTDYLLMRSRDPEKQRDCVQEIRKAATRAAQLTHQLLAFSRRQILDPRILNINQPIQSMEKMLRQIIGEDIQFELDLAPDLNSILADESNLEQIVANLAVNARDAMPGGGTLRIRTMNTRLDPASCAGREGVEPGDYVVMEVSDTGQGMDQETAQRAFEPFFTTKEIGKGTGLGLSTVFGIVRQLDGHIRLHSESNRGTTISIYFPVTREKSSVRSAEEVLSDDLDGSERVLVAEDEDMVRKVAVSILQMHGYQVAGVKDGEEALSLIQEHDSPFDLLITDMVMPRMNGRELAARVRQLRPETRVIFMSGFQEHILFSATAGEGTTFLEKPFSPRDLAKAVRRVLNETGDTKT